jgi:hypothetical protein
MYKVLGAELFWWRYTTASISGSQSNSPIKKPQGFLQGVFYIQW